MQKEREFIKSFFQFSIGQWISALISFITTPIMTWLIIPEEFGKASMFTIAFSLLLNIALLGTDQSFARMFYERSETEKKDLLWESLLPSLSIGFVLFFLIQVFWKKLSVVLFGDSSHFFPVFLLGINILIAIVERFATLAIRMKKRGVLFSLLRIVNSITNVCFTILYALFVSKSFYALIVGSLLSYTVSMFLSIYFEKDLWFGKARIEAHYIRSIIKYGLPFVPTFLISWIFQSVDRLTLRHYLGFTETGLYSAAFKVVSIMSLIQVGFTTFWIPFAYESYEGNPENKEVFGKVFVFISAAMFIIGSWVIVFKDAIFLLLANDYRRAANISPFLLLMPIMETSSYVTTVGISFSKKTYWNMVVVSISTLVNVLGNILLVLPYGAKGVALSTGLSYVLFFSIGTFISKQLYKVNYHLDRFYCSTMIFIITAFINTFNETELWQVFSAILGLVITSAIYKNELRYIFQLVYEELRNRISKKTGK